MYLLIMLRYSLHGLCAFPNMVINAKIMRKSGKNQEKKAETSYVLVVNVKVQFTWSVRIF